MQTHNILVHVIVIVNSHRRLGRIIHFRRFAAVNICELAIFPHFLPAAASPRPKPTTPSAIIFAQYASTRARNIANRI